MPDLYYGKGAYRRDNGNLPEFTLRNMFVEKTPSAEAGVVILSRPGMVEWTERGAGPIRGMFAKSGVYEQEVFAVSGSDFYKGATNLGAVTGSGPCSFAASSTDVLVTLGGTPYLYDDVTPFGPVTFPDSANVTAVAFLGGYFIYLRANTHKFYWSAILDASSVDALDFASAESSSDYLRDVIVVGDELWLLGAETVEVWAQTGDADAPFSRVEARLYRKGVISTGCADEMDNTCFWVGNDGIVYRGGAVPEQVSDAGIEERISRSSSISAFSFTNEGHPVFLIHTDEGSFGFDAVTRQWHEEASFGATNWRASCACVATSGLKFGDDTDGRMWEFDGSFTDDLSTLERRFTAGIALKGGVLSFDNVQVEANVGRTQLLTGTGSAPVIEMRSSRDAGATWSSWRAAEMGAQGNYRARSIWRRCGLFDAPGCLLEFRCTDPVPLRISRVTYNEELGGRAR